MLVIAAFYPLGCFGTPKTRSKVEEENPPWWSRHAPDRTLLGTQLQAVRHIAISSAVMLKVDSKITREGGGGTKQIQAPVCEQKQESGYYSSMSKRGETAICRIHP